MLRIIHFVQNLSLDITLGAVISSLFLAEVMDVAINWHMMLGLAIAIWLIYTVDHLWDARRVEGKAVNPRHAFHQKHGKPIIVFAIVLFGIGLYNTFLLPWPTIRLGLILVAFSGLYFLYLRWTRSNAQKELFAALVYTAGIATAPISQLEGFETSYLWILVEFLLLAYANLLIIPLYEEALDVNDKKPSIATRLGGKEVRRRIFMLLALCFVLNLSVWNEAGQVGTFAVILGMTLTLVLITLFPARFRAFQLYRILSDGIFFLPGLYLL